MTKAIFYDFDGVIKESTQIKTIAFYELYLKYGEEIAEKAKAHHIAHGGISRFEKFKLYHKEFLGIELGDEEVNQLADEFSQIVMEQVIQCNYVSGALESINKLSEKYDQFVVTGTPQQEIELIIQCLGIEKLFKGLYGSPEKKIVLSQQILDQYHYSNNEVVFIGDATTDYEAAKHHKFKFIFREHNENIGLIDDEEIIKIKDLTNLEQMIQKMNG